MDEDFPLLEAALAYAAEGQPVFPCWYGTFMHKGKLVKAKAPVTSNGFKDATTDEAQIRKWWNPADDDFDPYMIGLPTGIKWDVLDIDRKEAVDGWETFNLALNVLDLEYSVKKVVDTPSGGVHMYFVTDPDKPVRNASFAKHGIDIRGLGGYVIAPPSRIQSVGIYKEQKPHLFYASNDRLPAEAIHELLSDKSAGDKRLSAAKGSRDVNLLAIRSWLLRAAPGERNSSLYWAAKRVAEGGYHPEHLVDIAMQIGLDANEARATIWSAIKSWQDESE